MATRKITIRADWQDRGAARGADQTREKIDRMAEAGDRVNHRMVALGSAIAAAFTGAGVAAVTRMALDLARLADQVEITTNAFGAQARKWGSTGPEELGKLRTAVGGTLSDLNLMARVGAAVDAGLTFSQSRTAVEYLRRYSLAFQKDFNQLTQTIFTGLSRGSVLMLDDAGIIIDASSKIFDGLNEIEKKSALVGEAIRLMGEKMSALPAIESNIITETDRLTGSVENLKIAVGQIFSEDVSSFTASLTTLIDAATNAIKGIGQQPLPSGPPPGSGNLADDLQAAYKQVLQTGLTTEEAQILKGAATYAERAGRDPIDEDRRAFMAILEERAEMIQFIANFGKSVPIPKDAFAGYESPFSSGGSAIEAAQRLAEEQDRALTAALDRAEAEEKAAQAVERQYQALVKQAGDDLRSGRAIPDPGDLPVYIQRQNARLEEEDLNEALYGGLSPEEAAKFREELEKGWAAMTGGAEAFDQSALVTISAIENLTHQLNFLPEGFENVASAATNALRAMSTKNPFDIVSAGIGAISLVAGIFTSRAQRAAQIEEQNRRIREAYRREQEKLNEAIEDAADLAGKFARALEGLDTAQIRSQIGADITAIQQMLGNQGLTPDNIIEQSDRIRGLIREKYTFDGVFDERFSYLYRHLNEAVTAAQVIEEQKAGAEIAAREEQTEAVIKAIERQREAVLQALTDAEEAQRAARLREVGAQFDYIEAELRARYQPQLQAVAGDEAATLILREQVFADIAKIRAAEADAGTQALQGVSQRFSDARDRTNALYDGYVEAVRAATTDLSVPFEQAIAQQTQDFLARWEAGLPLESDTTSAIQDLVLWQLAVAGSLETAGIMNLTEQQISDLTGVNETLKTAFSDIASGKSTAEGVLADLQETLAGVADAVVVVPEDTSVPVTVPEDLGVPVILPEDFPFSIPITGADGLPLDIPVVLPDDLAVPVYVPESVLEIVNRAGNTAAASDSAANWLSGIDLEGIADAFRALPAPEEKILDFLANPEKYATKDISGKLDSIITNTDISGKLDSIATNTDISTTLTSIATNTDIGGKLDSIATNTDNDTLLTDIKNLLTSINGKNYVINVTVDGGNDFSQLNQNTQAQRDAGLL